MFMRGGIRRSSTTVFNLAMVSEASVAPSVDSITTATGHSSSLQRSLRWIPTSTKAIIASEQRLLSLVKTPYVQEQVDIGSGPSGSSLRWFRSVSPETQYINTVTFKNKSESAPTLVIVHGYGASQGFFFRNFDSLANHFNVIAIDQLGWGASSRPDFTCKSTEETEAWFIDSLEAWRKAKKLEKFILLGHSMGGYVASKYALKHPEHVQRLVLVGPVGFSIESDKKSEQLLRFKSTWMGAVINNLWELNFTPQKIIRIAGRWGPNLVRGYTSRRFSSRSAGARLSEKESVLLSDYMYHTLAAKASGELCLKYLFDFGGFARSPLVQSAADWKVPTSFIYGKEDWMYYKGAEAACSKMTVPHSILKIEKGGHFVFLENAPAFHAAVLQSCRELLEDGVENVHEDVEKVL